MAFVARLRPAQAYVGKRDVPSPNGWRLWPNTAMHRWPTDETLALLILARAVRTASERRLLARTLARLSRSDASDPPASELLARVSLRRLGEGKPSSRVRAEAVATAEADRESLRSVGGWIIGCWDASFPALLGAISDPPVWLFGRGDLALARERPQLAVVGARRCTRISMRLAEQWCAQLAGQGVLITSGLAAGVDGAAHRGALRGAASASFGGAVAVVGHGVDRVYPRQHASLAGQIVEGGGLIVSEYPPGVGPRQHHFPQRNRIISGLADAVLVVEATDRSGSLITARMALEQGRDVYAVPGSVVGGAHDGCHRLLRNGAALVQSPEEILGLLAATGTWQPPATAAPSGPSAQPQLADPVQARIWQLCRREPTTVDELLHLIDEPTQAVLGALVHLEVAGLVEGRW